MKQRSTSHSPQLLHIPAWVAATAFYQIFPDRFAVSPRAPKPKGIEPWLSEPNLYGFKGGDLYGIIERLSYLEDLGVNGIYLNPIFASTANHRYHTFDYYQVDPILGGNQALAELLSECHKRGIRVVLDGVFNHASRGFYQFNHALENGRHSPYLDWFHFNPGFIDAGQPIRAYPHHPNDSPLAAHGHSAFEKYGYHCWWDLPALPKFNTDNPEVRDFIFDVATYWIDFGIDGWRLDVPEEIDDAEFWREFRRRVKSKNPEAYIVGEIWHEAPRWLQGDLFDAVMNYPFGKAAIGCFLAESLNHEQFALCGYRDITPISTQAFADSLRHLLSIYPTAVNFAQMNFVGSHDTPRILNCGRGDVAGVKMVFTSLFMFPGAPCIYYGDEIGMSGNHDPDCRRSFDWDAKTWNQELLDHVKACAHARASHSAMQLGELHYAQPRTNGLWLGRRLATDLVFALFNTGLVEHDFIIPDEIPIDRSVKVKLRDLISGQDLKITNHGGKPAIALPARTSVIFTI